MHVDWPLAGKVATGICAVLLLLWLGYNAILFELERPFFDDRL